MKIIIGKYSIICFIWFPIDGLGEPNIKHHSVCFTRIVDFNWRVSDWEELVGVFRTVPLPYPIYTPFLQVRVDSIVSAVLALVK